MKVHINDIPRHHMRIIRIYLRNFSTLSFFLFQKFQFLNISAIFSSWRKCPSSGWSWVVNQRLVLSKWMKLYPLFTAPFSRDPLMPFSTFFFFSKSKMLAERSQQPCSLFRIRGQKAPQPWIATLCPSDNLEGWLKDFSLFSQSWCPSTAGITSVQQLLAGFHCSCSNEHTQYSL